VHRGVRPGEGERTQPGPQHERLAAIAVGDTDRQRLYRIRGEGQRIQQPQVAKIASASGTARLVTANGTGTHHRGGRRTATARDDAP